MDSWSIFQNWKYQFGRIACATLPIFYNARVVLGRVVTFFFAINRYVNQKSVDYQRQSVIDDQMHLLRKLKILPDDAKRELHPTVYLAWSVICSITGKSLGDIESQK